MTPFLLFSYALALAGGLLLVGIAATAVFAAALWLLGGRASGRPTVSATASLNPNNNLLASHTGAGITGQREP